MSHSKRKKSNVKLTTDWIWWCIFSLVVFLSLFSRLYKVSQPDHVCWDETHFGKMGSWYINRTFFFDVHPPLGKMLIAMSGYLSGYDGNFPFEKPGDKYENVSYIGMRTFCTILGASVIPFAFLTVWELTHSLNAALFSSIFILADVGILTLSRYILLDPILLCFMMAAVFGIVKVGACYYKPFSLKWWGWLLFTGVSIACCISVKFVGLFTILLAGLRTVVELWDIFGDLTKPITYAIKHLFARAICLILCPIALYIMFFYIHLALLNKSGNGDGFYSSGFQSQLEGNSLYNASMPKEVAFGAIVSLKNHRTGGGYLHSHWHLYPEEVGARQQQITTYSHKDENNHWLIKPYDKEVSDDDPVKLLKHGDILRLEHVSTKRNLHSHREPAPVTKKHYQVTGYGENGLGDANDVWKVLIVGGSQGEVVQTVTSQLKFVHYLQHCILTTTSKQLPQWAYEQKEVTCNPNLRDKSAIWNVEHNVFSKLPNASFEEYAPSFLERFIESHAVMIQGNAVLKPKEGEITSKPWQWPINYKGQFFSGNDYRIYLLGNPIIWWLNLNFLIWFLIVYVYNAVRYQRGYRDTPEVAEIKRRMLQACCWLFIGWVLHYAPFWAMERILYFHHYFPASLFSCMLTGVIITYVLETLYHIFSESTATVLYHIIVGGIYSAVAYSFYSFSPLSYGMFGPPASEPNSTMYGLRWMDSWEF